MVRIDTDGPLIAVATTMFGKPAVIPDVARAAGVRWTHDPAFVPVADVVLVHVPDYPARRPVVKRPGQLWVAWWLESPAHYPQLEDRAFMAQFDLTMSYLRTADVWVPYIPRTEEWPDIQAAPPAAQGEGAAIAMFTSTSYDRSGRWRLIQDLARVVPIDSYGKLMHNRDLPGPDRGRDSKIEALRRYPFTLAFENAIGTDYVTEKIFEPMWAGSIPVYLGAPNVADFVPPDSYIDAGLHGGGVGLGAYLGYLSAHPEAAGRYHAWRQKPLPETLLARSREIERDAFVRLAEVCRERLAVSP